MRALLLLAALVVPQQGAPAPPLRYATGVAPDTVTVGDRFNAFVSVAVPPGASVSFGALPKDDTLQQTDSAQVVPQEGERVAAAYPLVAWVAGSTPASTVSVTITLADGRSTAYQLPLRLPFVRSVLPADTIGLKPKPAKGLLAVPAGRDWQRFAWAAALLILVLALLWVAWLLRARRARATPPLGARDAALAELDALLSSGPRGSAAEVERFYTAATRILRRYLAVENAAWGEELTGSELLAAARAAGMEPARREGLSSLLREADPVKFAAEPATAEQATGFAASLRDWLAAAPETGADEKPEAAA